jgi:hypothetical protein
MSSSGVAYVTVLPVLGLVICLSCLGARWYARHHGSEEVRKMLTKSGVKDTGTYVHKRRARSLTNMLTSMKCKSAKRARDERGTTVHVCGDKEKGRAAELQHQQGAACAASSV